MPALIQMLLLCATGAFLAYWGVWAARTEISLTGAWVKTAATGLPAAAILWAAPHAGLALIGLGLAFGALGDFALARRGDKAFLIGMAAFAIGHLLYAATLWQRSQSLGALPPSPAQIAALLALATLALSTEVWLAPHAGPLKWPVRGYVAVIVVMGAAALLLAPNAGAALLRAGAALFILSDLLLALRLFVTKTPRWQTRLGYAVWPAYWLGQMLILYGAILYWTFPIYWTFPKG